LLSHIPGDSHGSLLATFQSAGPCYLAVLGNFSRKVPVRKKYVFFVNTEIYLKNVSIIVKFSAGKGWNKLLLLSSLGSNASSGLLYCGIYILLFNHSRFFFFVIFKVLPFCGHQPVISKGNTSLFFSRNITNSANSIGFLLQTQTNEKLTEILFSDLSSGLTEAQPGSKFHSNSEPEFIFSVCMKESSFHLVFKHPHIMQPKSPPVLEKCVRPNCLCSLQEPETNGNVLVQIKTFLRSSKKKKINLMMNR